MSEKTKSQIIRESNISTFSPIMSKEDIITDLFSAGSTKDKEVARSLANNPDYTEKLSDVLEAMTIEPVLTRDVIKKLYDLEQSQDKSDAAASHAGEFIKIVHASDYFITKDSKGKDVNFSTTNFGIKKENLELKVVDNNSQTYYEYKEKYGVFKEKDKNKHFTLDNICKYTLDSSRPDQNLQNNVSHDKNLSTSRLKTSLSFTLIDSPNLRIGTKNSLELSTFLNSLSTIELSKSLPYFNIEFVLPRLNKTAGGNTYQTASITQFLNGTPNRDNGREDPTTGTYKSLSASFVREINTKGKIINQDAVKTNISVFTTPQTLNSFNEKHVGHTENKNDKNDNFRRQNSIHDYTKPFMTIKNFSVDIAPTQGLMSFKTGRISLVLHDRTRMSEIAPFIKPDLYGSFGAELIITYGWSHIDGMNKIKGKRGNFFGEFLDKSKVTEKYIITNSSFNIDNSGQVNIDLNIAMRGPIDIRSNTIVSDSKEKLKQDHVKTFLETYNLEKEKFDRLTKNFITLDLDPFVNKIKAEIKKYNSKDNKSENLTLVSHAGSAATIKKYKLAIKKIKRKNKSGNTTATIEEFHNAIKILYTTEGKTSVDNSFINTILKSNVENKPVETGPPSPEKNVLNNLCVDIDGSITTKKTHVLLTEVLLALTDYLESCYLTYYKHKKRGDARSKKIVDSIIGNVDSEDPFFNKDWVARYFKALGTKTEKANTENRIIPINFKNGSVFKGKKYITLGTFITSLISTYMCGKGKFNEVQIISYTMNDNAGLMKNLNLASLLIPREDLEEFLQDMFTSGTTMTIEGIISQVLNRFVMTSTQICYGFKELYKRENDVVKPRVEESELHKAGFNNRLENIYRTIAGLQGEDIKLSDVAFSMPKVKLIFDTLVSRREEGDITICRVSIIDQNDNPYKAVSEIMRGVYSNGIIKNAALLNKAKSKKNAHIKKNRNEKAIAEADFHRESQKIIMKMLGKSYSNKTKQYENDPSLMPLIKEELDSNNQPTGRYEIIDKHKFNSSLLKNRIKSIMPSVTYGTQNSAIIDASVTTINEAKLNTVYLTRSDRNGDNSKRQIEAQVKFQEDMPLRVSPSQANLTIFGCPFVNFAQYIFLDFETGTSVDNQYAITGIKHDFSPGKFTTSLTLSYGDIYGKYEAALDTLTKAMSDKYTNKLQEVFKAEKEAIKRKKELEAKIKANEARIALGNSSTLGESAITVVDEVSNIVKSISDYRTPAEILDVDKVNKKYRSSITKKFVKVEYPYEGRKHTLIEVAANITKDIYEHFHKDNNDENFKNVYTVTSGFRDIKSQQTIWDNGIKKYKQQIIDTAKIYNIEETDIPNLDAQAAFTAWRWIALPGSSNHQEGFTFDLKMASNLSNNSQDSNMLKDSDSYKNFIDTTKNPYKEFLTGISGEAWHWILDIEGQIAYLKFKNDYTEDKEVLLRALNKATKDQLSILRQINIVYKNKVLDALKESSLPDGKLTMQGRWEPKRDAKGKKIYKKVKKTINGKEKEVREEVLEYNLNDTYYQKKYKYEQDHRPRMPRGKKITKFKNGQSKTKKSEEEIVLTDNVITDLKPMKLRLKDSNYTNTITVLEFGKTWEDDGVEIDFNDLHKINISFCLFEKYKKIEAKAFKFNKDLAFFTLNKDTLTVFLGYTKTKENVVILDFFDKPKTKIDLSELAYPKFVIEFLDAITNYEEKNGQFLEKRADEKFLNLTFKESKTEEIKNFFKELNQNNRALVSNFFDLDEISILLSENNILEVENIINATFISLYLPKLHVCNSSNVFSNIPEYEDFLFDSDTLIEEKLNGESMFNIEINLENYKNRELVKNRKDFFNKLIPLMFDYDCFIHFNSNFEFSSPDLTLTVKAEDKLNKNGAKIKKVLEEYKNDAFFEKLSKNSLLKISEAGQNNQQDLEVLNEAKKSIIEKVRFTNESIEFSIIDINSLEYKFNKENEPSYLSHKIKKANFTYYDLASNLFNIIHSNEANDI